MSEFRAKLNGLLDTFFHLPTMVIIAIVSLLIVGQIYQVSINLGRGFVRLTSNQGNLTFYWEPDCCRLDW